MDFAVASLFILLELVNQVLLLHAVRPLVEGTIYCKK